MARNTKSIKSPAEINTVLYARVESVVLVAVWVAWVAGIAKAEGPWQTFAACCHPLYAWWLLL